MDLLGIVLACTCVGMATAGVILFLGIHALRAARRERAQLHERQQLINASGVKIPRRPFPVRTGSSLAMGVAVMLIIVGCLFLLLAGSCGTSLLFGDRSW